MVQELTRSVKSIVRTLLVEQWDPTNVVGYDPTLAPGAGNFVLIHTGAYSYNPRDPQVAIPRFDEGVLGGGATGYTGHNATDGTKNQDRDGTVLIDVWAEGDARYNDEHAEDVVNLLANEVERILHDNSGGYGDLRYLSPRASYSNDDSDVQPVVYGQQIQAGYGWLRETPTA